MNKLSLILAAGVISAPMAAHAQSDCGEVSIAQMNWAAAKVTTEVAKFVLEQGYGCKVSLVPSDTIPAVTSVAENNEPDVITNLWLNSTGDAYDKLEKQGKIKRLNSVLEPGGVEGWWIPTYLAEEHPELTTIDGVLNNPDLVGGRFYNCPDGWGCRVVSDNLIKALDLPGHGIKIFNAGSGQVLATSMADAVLAEEPWFGYYWGPTPVLGKYDMTKIDLGPVKPEVHARNQNPDTNDPGVSDFPAAPILTAATADFIESHPEVAEFFSRMAFPTSDMSAILAWQDGNNASADEAAVYYLTNYQDQWREWLNDAARENLASILDQG